MIGGFVGAVILSNISLAAAKGWMSALLIFLGLVIFARFGFDYRIIPMPEKGLTVRWLAPIGVVGGFVDATGGGGWGPVVTPSLLTVTAHEPRKVVGTVNATEFLVAMSVSIGFLTGIAQEDIPWAAVLGLVTGGVIVAPFAARFAGRLPHALMGTLVGGLIVLVNGVNIVAATGDLPLSVDLGLMGAVIVVTGIVAYRAWQREKLERAARNVTSDDPALSLD